MWPRRNSGDLTNSRAATESSGVNGRIGAPLDRARGSSRLAPQRRMKFRLLLLVPVLLLPCAAETSGPQVLAGAHEDTNAVILRIVQKMPRGGKYATSNFANQQLSAAIRCAGEGLTVQADSAIPSYCSGATYLVFLAALEELAKQQQIAISRSALDALPVTGNRDGEGVWGRWNANGPGTARLFAETGLGKNFTDWEKARPGDFLKVWWSGEIGARERGHSVIFLGREKLNGVEQVRFWSSNVPDGYGEKVIPRGKIVRALFSRLDRPAMINRVAGLSPTDEFLASMLKRAATPEEVKQFCKVDE